MRFDVHGVGVEVTGDPALTERVERDFSLFRAARPAQEPPHVAIEVADGAAVVDADWGPPVGRTKDARVHRRGPRQLFDSGPRCAVVYDFARERGRVAGADLDLVHEKAYLLVMSRVGALLDRRGLHRVHAMAVAREGAAALCLLPTGGGKTTLALALLERSGVELLSEEVPLVRRDGTLLPFPIRIGVVAGTPVAAPPELVSSFRRSRHGPKTLIDARWLVGRVAGPSPPRVLLVGHRSSAARPAAQRLPQRRAWDALLRLCVLGIGLPQLLEYSAPWSPRAALALPPVLLSRLRACRTLLARCRAWELTLAPDAAANAALVLELLEDAARADGRTRAGAASAPRAAAAPPATAAPTPLPEPPAPQATVPGVPAPRP